MGNTCTNEPEIKANPETSSFIHAEEPKRMTENNELAQTKIVFHHISLKNAISNSLRTFLVTFQGGDNIKGEFTGFINDSKEINLPKFERYSIDLNLDISFESKLFKNKTCKIYQFKTNHLYFFDSQEKYDFSFYITNHMTDTTWHNDKITIDWNDKSYSFDTTHLSQDIRCFTVFNVAAEMKYYNDTFISKLFSKTQSNHIKMCLYLKDNIYKRTNAFEITPLVFPKITLNEMRIEAKGKLEEFIKDFNLINNDHTLDDELKRLNICKLYVCFKEDIEKLSYFKRKISDIDYSSQSDFALYCNYLIYLTIQQLPKLTVNAYKIFTLRYNYLLDEIALKEKENMTTIKDLEDLCFYANLIRKNIIQIQHEKEFMKMIPVDINSNDYANINYSYAINFLGKLVNQLNVTSKLVKRLNQLNSPINKNLINNEEEFELSYIPLNILKEHLTFLLKTRIYRYFSKEKENGITHHLSRLVGINEYILFHMSSIYVDPHIKENKKWSVRLAIVMVLIHELFGHSKIRFKNEGDCSELKNDNAKEAGRIIKNYISTNEMLINYMKNCDNQIAKELLTNMSLWIGKDFKILEGKLKEKEHKILGVINNPQINRHDSKDNTPVVSQFYYFYDKENQCHNCT